MVGGNTESWTKYFIRSEVGNGRGLLDNGRIVHVSHRRVLYNVAAVVASEV